MKKVDRFILAFDPSLSGTGYCVLDCLHRHPRIAELGTISSRDSSDPHSVKLAMISGKVRDLRANYSASLYSKVFLEKGFTKFNKSTQATFKARGALESELVGLEIVELSPTNVKLVVAGDGKASKEDVANAVRDYLNLKDFVFDTEDESDAVAVALTGYLTLYKEDHL